MMRRQERMRKLGGDPGPRKAAAPIAVLSASLGSLRRILIIIRIEVTSTSLFRMEKTSPPSSSLSWPSGIIPLTA